MKNNGLCFETSAWSDTLFKRYHDRSASLQKIVSDGHKRQPRFGNFACDMHARLYLQHEPTKKPIRRSGTEWAQTLHDEATALPDWARLRQRCRRNPFASGIATEQILRAIADKVPEQEKAPAKNGAKRREPKPAPMDADTARRDMRQAAQAAADAIDQAETATGPLADALGINAGNDPTKPQTEEDLEALLALYETIRDNPTIKDIADLAGRIRNTARTSKRATVRQGTGEIIGVSPGEPAILPQELAGLRSTRPIRLRTLDRIMRRHALGYRTKPQPKSLDKGPMVVMVDVSGSMQQGKADHLTAAKALALALMCTATRERRTFAICTFNARIQYQAKFPRGTHASVADLLALLDQQATGGTSFDAAIAWSLEQVRTDRDLARADLILITDGADAICLEIAEAIDMQAQATGLNLYGLGINVPSEILQADLKDKASECWSMSSIDASTGALMAPIINP